MVLTEVGLGMNLQTCDFRVMTLILVKKIFYDTYGV